MNRLLHTGLLLLFAGSLLACGLGTARVHAASDEGAKTAQDLLAAAAQYEKDAAAHLAEAAKYEERARGIEPLADTKGYRRVGLITAGESHRMIALELQTRAAVHRIMAEGMMDKSP